MKKKKIGIWIMAGIGIVLAVLLVIAGVFLLKINGRLKELQDGFTFEAQYQVIMPEEKKTDSVLLSIMKQTQSLKGSMTGETDGSCWHLVMTPDGKEHLEIEVYQQQEELRVNMEKLYEGFRGNVIKEQPLLGALLPEWDGGAYLTNEQLEEITGMKVGTEFSIESGESAPVLSLAAFEKISYESGDPEKIYFRLKDLYAENYDVIIGLEKNKLFQNPVESSIILTSYVDRVQIQMELTINPDENPILAMPEDIWEEEQVAGLKKLWEAIENVRELLEGLQGIS